MGEPDGDLVVVLVDEPDPTPVVVLVDPPTLGEVAVVVLDGTAVDDSGAAAAHHDQVVPVEQWLITHGLPFVPSGLDVRGLDGGRLYPRRVAHPARGRTRLEFTRPVAGTADLS